MLSLAGVVFTEVGDVIHDDDPNVKKYRYELRFPAELRFGEMEKAMNPSLEPSSSKWYTGHMFRARLNKDTQNMSQIYGQTPPGIN